MCSEYYAVDEDRLSIAAHAVDKQHTMRVHEAIIDNSTTNATR